MHHQTAIGIMDEAYFCPRQEIIKWINLTLQLNIDSIEDLGTGAVYCQLLDYAFGQRVPMQKINWKAKFQYQFINNLKIFQNTLQRLGITRKFDIQKLSKAKYQDNLETIQWLKRYIELNGNLGNYNALERRNGFDLYSISQAKKVLGNPFKSAGTTTLSNVSCLGLNQSVCLSTTATTKQRVSLKPRQSFIANKQNTGHLQPKDMKKKNGLQLKSDGDKKINEIRKVLMGNDDSQTKVNDIHKIIYGYVESQLVKCEQEMKESEGLMDIEGVESEGEEVLVF